MLEVFRTELRVALLLMNLNPMLVEEILDEYLEVKFTPAMNESIVGVLRHVGGDLKCAMDGQVLLGDRTDEVIFKRLNSMHFSSYYCREESLSPVDFMCKKLKVRKVGRKWIPKLFS